MIIQKLANAFIYDELAAKRWLKGSLLAIMTLVLQVMVTDSWMKWSIKEWIYHMIPVILGFAIGSIQGSPKPPPPTKP